MPDLGAKRMRRLMLPETIALSPGAPTLGATVGDTVQLTATSSDIFGNAATDTFTWTSSDPTKMTVSNAGLVTRVAAGSSIIKATSVQTGRTASVTIA